MQAVLAVIGLIAWNTDTGNIDFAPTYWARWGSYQLTQGQGEREAVRSFVTKIELSTDLGTVMADENLLSLIAGSLGTQDNERVIIPYYQNRPVDTSHLHEPE